jgi:uncharacterized UBP type Zn finger protein
MSNYVDSASQNDSELWYDLTAVLLHAGPNANEGHYSARAYDHQY